MSKKAKLCIWCHKNPASVPADRNALRFVKQICSECHSHRLVGDLQVIMALDAKKRADANDQVKPT